MRERRVGEGEREEMRGDFRRGGRHSACAGTLNKSGLPQPARPPASLRAGMRHTGQPNRGLGTVVGIAPYGRQRPESRPGHRLELEPP